MTTAHITLPQGAPKRTLEERGQGKAWVTLGPNHNIHNGGGHGLFQTQLFFSEAMPATAYNRVTRVGPPAPIVIEKLMPQLEQENVDSTRSSISFSALSEERLLAAVRLAKRDLRRRHNESMNNSFVKHQQEDSPHNTSNVDQQEAGTIKMKSKASSPKEKLTRPRANLLVYTPQKLSIPPNRGEGLSPPTRDPGPGQVTTVQEPQLSLEIRKLQNELGVYIQKIEQLVNRGQIMEEILEPDEQHKMEIHQQKQAARSARIIYALQQQVKEIQEDLDKLRSQKIGHTKKSRAMARLAAAHRGAVRAMQVFSSQLPEPAQGRVPSHHKELGQLLRQLSLCSAKVEVDQGSAMPETALDILQKLETLDIALSKQERPWRRQAGARSSSPAQKNSPSHGVLPPRAPRGPTTSGVRRPRKAAGPKRRLPGWRAAPQNPRATHPPPVDRRQVLRAGLESLVQQRQLRENRHIGSEQNTNNRKGGPLHLERNKMRDTGFQQPTVSSRLRVNQLPQKELSVPWIPTSPHSPPPQRSPQRSRPEPRCLFSPSKPSTSPPKQRESRRGDSEQSLSSDKKKQAQQEALRQAWLDKVTIQRLRELNQLSKEEAECIQRLRSEVGSPTQQDEGAEQTARERIQLNEAQAVESAEQLSEALLEDLFDDAVRAAWVAETDRQLEVVAQRGLQAPTLESMLLRMDEIQRDQEEVRRRFATITYSDPLYWDRGEAKGSQWHAPGSRPASPQPIRLTRPVLRHTSTADIVLEKPVEAGHSVLSETSLTEEGSRGEQQPSNSGVIFPGPVERSRGTGVSVPGGMLRSIQQYREEHNAYLRLVAHEAVGSFNPWAIADR